MWQRCWGYWGAALEVLGTWGHFSGGAGDTQVLPGGEHTGRASTLTHSFPFLFPSLHRSPSLHPLLSFPYSSPYPIPIPATPWGTPPLSPTIPQPPQQYFPLPAGKGCSAPSAPGVLRMSAVPEPLGRPRSSSFRSLGGTLEATLGMGPLEAEREEMRILKVCFYSNSFNMGKNFKLVKCPVTTEIRVRGAGRRTGGHLVCLGAVCPSGIRGRSWQEDFSRLGSPQSPWAPNLGGQRGDLGVPSSPAWRGRGFLCPTVSSCSRGQPH